MALMTPEQYLEAAEDALDTAKSKANGTSSANAAVWASVAECYTALYEATKP